MLITRNTVCRDSRHGKRYGGCGGQATSCTNRWAGTPTPIECPSSTASKCMRLGCFGKWPEHGRSRLTSSRHGASLHAFGREVIHPACRAGAKDRYDTPGPPRSRSSGSSRDSDNSELNISKNDQVVGMGKPWALSEHCRLQTTFLGRRRPNFGQCYAMPANPGPISAKIGPDSAECPRCRPCVSRIWQTFGGQIRPNST